MKSSIWESGVNIGVRRRWGAVGDRRTADVTRRRRNEINLLVLDLDFKIENVVVSDRVFKSLGLRNTLGCVEFFLRKAFFRLRALKNGLAILDGAPTPGTFGNERAEALRGRAWGTRRLGTLFYCANKTFFRRNIFLLFTVYVSCVWVVLLALGEAERNLFLVTLGDFGDARLPIVF